MKLNRLKTVECEAGGVTFSLVSSPSTNNGEKNGTRREEVKWERETYMLSHPTAISAPRLTTKLKNRVKIWNLPARSLSVEKRNWCCSEEKTSLEDGGWAE